MSLGCVHEFELVKEKNWYIVRSSVIHEDFIDYINEQVSIENNLFFDGVPSINPSFKKGPYSESIPSEKGFNLYSETIFNRHSVQELKEMFSQWKGVALALPADLYYYDLESMDEKTRNSLTEEELKWSTDYYFDKKEIIKSINICLNIVDKLKDPQYILYHKGI